MRYITKKVLVHLKEWKDSKILGNLELDFTKPDGTAYNTVVIAGENGSGKTNILETLVQYCINF